MKQVVLVPGTFDSYSEFFKSDEKSLANQNWYPWLNAWCEKNKIPCDILEFPKPYDPEPVYEEWVEVLNKNHIDNETIIIGCSFGGGFLLRYFSEYKNSIPMRLILVAPWLDPEKESTSHFMDFTIDSSITDRTNVNVFISSDDPTTAAMSFSLVQRQLPSATYHKFTNKGHFEEKDFPELLELLK